MIEKVSSNLGILINWKSEDFDLNIAHELIKKKKKFAWGTGGVTLKPEDEELPDGNILGLLKTSGQNNILYGVTVDISEEFRDYLNFPQSKLVPLIEEHKKYRPDWLKDTKNKAFLFLSDIFLLNTQIEANKIIKINGKPFSSGDRSSVFIDIKKSGLNPNKMKIKDFDSFSDNPLVQILDYKEDDLTNSFSFLLKNNEDIAKEFFKLCRITKKAVNFEIYLREKIKNSTKTNIPDITFEWEDDGSNIFVEAKLDSPVDKRQLNRYLSKGKVICITRAGEELEVRKKVKGVTFISWEDIYRIIEKISNNNRSKKMLMVKYFLGYLTYLGISAK